MAETTLPAPRPQAPGPPPRLLRPVRRRRLGLGLGQGDLLVRRDDHAARLPAGPRVLLHRPEDRRPRPAAVVADQLLPARERDAAVPRAGRRDAPVAPVAARDPAAGRAHRRRRRGRRPGLPLRRRQRRHGRQGGRVLHAAPSAPATSTCGRRRRRCPRPGHRPPSVVIGNTMYVIGGYGPDGKPTDTVYSMTLANDGTFGEWTTVTGAPLPVARAGLSAAAVSDGIVIMGGTDGTAPCDGVWKTQMTTTAPVVPGAVGRAEPAGRAERRRRRDARRRLRVPDRRQQRHGAGGHRCRSARSADRTPCPPTPTHVPALEVQRADEPAEPPDEPVGLHVQRRDVHPGRLGRHEPARRPRCGRRRTRTA